MTRQSGNALFLILIAVALFAALSYAATQSSRGGGSIDKENAEILAAQVMQYGAQIEQIITRLKVIPGCSDTEISFERSPFDGSDVYYNSNSPLDFSCHVFHANGGNLTYLDLPSGVNDGSEYLFHHRTCIDGVGIGTADSSAVQTCGVPEAKELMLFIPNVDLNICLSVNRLQDIPSFSGEPPQDHSGAWETTQLYFTGTFPGPGYQISDQSGGHSFEGKTLGCFEGGGTANFPADNYHIYYVLIAR